MAVARLVDGIDVMDGIEQLVSQAGTNCGIAGGV